MIAMKKMKVETLIALFATQGIVMFRTGDDVSLKGGGMHAKPNSHPYWRLVKIHKNEIYDYFGVSKP